MNGKKAKKLRRLSKIIAIGKPASEAKKVYNRLKTVKENG